MEEFDFDQLVECYDAVSQNVDKLTGAVEGRTVAVKDEDGADDVAETRAAKPAAANNREVGERPPCAMQLQCGLRGREEGG
eukprot:3018897-Pyramimonas_sp.AAC.1